MTTYTRPFLICCVIWLGNAGAWPQTVELSNEHMVLRFDPSDGYALCSLVNRAHGTDFIAPRPKGIEQNRSPWSLHVVGTKAKRSLTAMDARQAAHGLQGDTLTITWSGVGTEAVPGDLTVAATIRLPKGSPKAYFRAKVTGRTQGRLWQLDFPRVFGIRDFPDCQMSLPWYWGRLVRQPMQLGRRASLVYPEPASMQWFSFWGVEDKRHPPLAVEDGRDSETGWSPDYSDACGLYWASEDGDLHIKRFAWDPTLGGDQLAWHIENIPSLPAWPVPQPADPVSVGYEMPYENVIAVFSGDWHEAGRIYLEWARNQEWTRRGTADQWPRQRPDPGSEALMRWVPPWFREIGFWAKFYHEPAKILPEWAAYREWLRVPMASHWYRYNIAAFNDNDPEHLPPDPYLLEGVRAAREIGVEPMPYVLSTIWDTDTQSWLLEDGQRSALRNEGGDIPPWNIGPNVFAYMCLSQEPWHAKMREICRKLIWEHGMSGVYLDVLAAGAARTCYSPHHGHPIHGGNYWGQGARALMTKLRADIRRLTPDACFFTEEIGEHLMDVMDGFLTLDLTRSYTPGGEQVWPILTAVYHPYTINFGSDAQIGMTPETFAALYGRQLVWGSQPLHSVLIAPIPEEGNTTAEVFREYTRAYWVAGHPFLMGGKMVRLAVRPKDARPGRCGLELTAAPHSVAYDLAKDRKKIWTGPSVMASAWERGGDIGIVMANITNARQTVELTVRREPLGIQVERMVRLWPAEPEVIGAAVGKHALALDPWRCAVYVITRDPQAASKRLNKLEDTPWQLQVVENGPIPSVTGPIGALFACSDGPVLNEPGDKGTVATPYRFDEHGKRVRREGRQADVRGAKAEGHGLPRDVDKQPFALLRPLPHRLIRQEKGVMVLSGDDHHLLATVSGRAEIRFPSQGLLVVSRAATGEVIRSLSAGLTQTVSTPDGEDAMIAWARFDADEMARTLVFGDAAIRQRIQPLADRLAGLMSCPDQQRDAALAAASREFVEIAESFREMPGALSPVSPLTKLHERLNALVVARAGTNVCLSAEHPWLAPGLDKHLWMLVTGEAPSSVRLLPIGSWRDDGFVAEPLRGFERTGHASVARPTVRLADARYVERVVPILGVARVERDGQKYDVCDILRLEANRPFQFLYDRDPITAVAGQPRATSIKVRNWSPIALTLRLGGSGPEGWAVTPVVPVVDAPALSDTKFDLTVTPAANAARGRYAVRAVANYTPAEDTGLIAALTVSVLDGLVPLHDKADAWEPPPPDARARIRNHGTFAVYAAAGEDITFTITNVRVTRYVDALSWRLLGPCLDVLKEGKIPVDQTSKVSHTAKMTGTHYLEVAPKQGSADVQFANRAVSEVATGDQPLRLFCSRITRHFFVPRGATEFELHAQDGGPAEGARFVITSPSGRVAFEADGNYNGARFPVKVHPGEAGKIWTIRVEPQQDLTFWLTGDVFPYLAASPAQILVRPGSK